MDTYNLPTGDFKSIFLIESPLQAMLSCTICIYSYTEKILETKQIVCAFRNLQDNFIYQIDFVRDYWTAFLNGFQYLQKTEIQTAIESLTMTLVYYF